MVDINDNVVILEGKYEGKTGTVIDIRETMGGKDNLVVVKMLGSMYSFMEKNLKTI